MSSTIILLPFKELSIEELFNIQLRCFNYVLSVHDALRNILLFMLSIFFGQPNAFIVLID